LRRWVRLEGLGRRLVVTGLLLALVAGVLVSLLTPPVAVSPAISTVGYKTQYGPRPQSTYLATSLSGGGQWGTAIWVQPGTAVNDRATLSGPSAYEARGTVTYSVFSDSRCDRWAAVAGGGTVGVNAGRVQSSNRVTLFSPGTYYWQATYSGDANNTASTSPCGSEKESVSRPHHYYR
jgi:hypothetical protein